MPKRKSSKAGLKKSVELWRIILGIFLPPLAVIDKGLSAFIIVLILTILGFIPGVIGAMYFIYKR